MEIEKIVKEVITHQLGCEKTDVVDNASLEDLGADSLDKVELVMALEEKWGIEISDAEADKLTEVRKIVEYIEKKLAQREGV